MTADYAPKRASLLSQMDVRTRDIFMEIVRAYLDTGDPVGSRTISRRGVKLSPASIRNVMSDLSELGLLDSPHISAGRLPTQQGLRLFVDGLLEIGDMKLANNERRQIQRRLAKAHGGDPEDFLGEASELLSGLAGGAGLVASPKQDAPVKHVEFVAISDQQALGIIVSEDGDVENRLLTLPVGLPSSTLVEASNYLNARMKGQTLTEARALILAEIRTEKSVLDATASRLVEQGLAHWTGEDPVRGRSLIVRGRANLIENTQAEEDVDRVRQLFADLDKKESLVQVLEGASEADGVRLFIGSENPLFSLSGSSVVVAPYMNAEKKVIGALGVIGPTRLDYARVIPLVDYTAQLVGQLLASGRQEIKEDD